MAAGTYTKNGASTALVRYADHPHCYYRIWLPQDNGGTFGDDVGVLCRLHGGGWTTTPVEISARENADGSELTNVTMADKALTAGWPFINIEYPYGGVGPTLQIWPGTVWPWIMTYAARAFQHIKDNAANATYWGSGNAINAAKVGCWGNSSGAHLALSSQLIPTEYAITARNDPYGLTQTAYRYRNNHKLAFVLNDGGAWDFTQIDPAVGTGARALFYRGTRYSDFKGVDADILKAASPWWWLTEDYPENKNLAIFSNYTGAPSVDPASWNPGTEVTGLLGADDSYWGGPIDDEFTRIGHTKNATYWGASTGSFPNPGPNVGLSGAGFANTFWAFLQAQGIAD